MSQDSVFGDGGIVITGTIVGGVATLQAVAGTDSATSFSLAENGASIVYTRHHDLRLFKVPVAGGVPVPEPIQRPVVLDTQVALTVGVARCGAFGVGSTRIVAGDDIFLTDPYWVPDPPCNGNICEGLAGFHAPRGNSQMQLLSMSLTGGATQVIQAGALSSMVFASPQISPVTGDLVVQRGGVWGHLQTHVAAGHGMVNSPCSKDRAGEPFAASSGGLVGRRVLQQLASALLARETFHKCSPARSPTPLRPGRLAIYLPLPRGIRTPGGAGTVSSEALAHRAGNDVRSGAEGPLLLLVRSGKRGLGYDVHRACGAAPDYPWTQPDGMPGSS